MQIQRYLSFIIFFFLVLQFALWDVSEIEDPRDKYKTTSEAFDKTKNQFGQKMKGVHLMESSPERNLWVLNAKEAISKNKDEEWVLEDIKMTFFGKNAIEYYVDAVHGEINITSKDLRMFGEVHVRTSTGYQFNSDELFYVANERMIRSPKEVLLEGPKDVKGENLNFSGDEFKAFLDTNEMHLDGNVKALKNLKSKLQMQLNSDSAILSSEVNKTQQFKNVDITYQGKKIKGPLAFLSLDEEGINIRELTVQGGVDLLDGKNSGKSQKLFMDVLKNRIELTGDPRFFSGEDELIGEKIIFHRGGDQIEVKGAKASFQQGQVLDDGSGQ